MGGRTPSDSWRTPAPSSSWAPHSRLATHRKRWAGVEDWELRLPRRAQRRGFGVLIAGQEKAIVRVTPHELILRRLQEVID